jgi:hypothetical protein
MHRPEYIYLDVRPHFSIFCCRILHDLLTLRAFVVRRVPVLIAINKTDMHTAHDSASIIALLEKEVEKRRIAARSKLADLTPGSAGGDAKQQLPDAAFKCVFGSHSRFA